MQIKPSCVLFFQAPFTRQFRYYVEPAHFIYTSSMMPLEYYYYKVYYYADDKKWNAYFIHGRTGSSSIGGSWSYKSVTEE